MKLDLDHIDRDARAELRAAERPRFDPSPVCGAFKWWLRNWTLKARKLDPEVTNAEIREEALRQIESTADQTPETCRERVQGELRAIVAEELP